MESPLTDIQSRVTAAVEAFARGEIVVVTDDDDRENEGDLVMAAVHATPEKMAFIIRNTAGIVCAPVTTDLAHRLRLSPMVAENDAPHGTAFTVSIEAATGVTTGISAADRARTIQVAVDPAAGPGDLVRPGHVFPLRARPRGVLERRGQTEAAVDLTRLAGLTPGGVLCEVMNDDGTMARGPQLVAFSRRHALPVVTVDEIATYLRTSAPAISAV